LLRGTLLATKQRDFLICEIVSFARKYGKILFQRPVYAKIFTTEACQEEWAREKRKAGTDHSVPACEF
jgi:hypothetical protein